MDYFHLYDKNADRKKNYLIKCYDLEGNELAFYITNDIKEVERIKKVVKNCKVVEL